MTLNTIYHFMLSSMKELIIKDNVYTKNRNILTSWEELCHACEPFAKLIDDWFKAGYIGEAKLIKNIFSLDNLSISLYLDGNHMLTLTTDREFLNTQFTLTSYPATGKVEYVLINWEDVYDKEYVFPCETKINNNY